MARIRLAGQGDAGILTELRCAFLEEMGQQLPDGFADGLRYWIEDALRDGRLQAWLAELDGRVVGSVAVNPYPHLPSASYPGGMGWYVLNVYVRPDWRRGGIGHALLDTVGAAAREQGVDMLNLHATASARTLYERLGFRASLDAMSLPLA